jgi:hypothetical protein
MVFNDRILDCDGATFHADDVNPHLQIKHFLLFTYSLFIILSKIYRRMYPIEYRTSVGKNGHLFWDWMNFKGYEIILAILY